MLDEHKKKVSKVATKLVKKYFKLKLFSSKIKN